MNATIQNRISSADPMPISNFLFYGLLLFFFFEYVRPGTYFPPLEAAKLNTLIPVSIFVLTLFSSRGRPNNEILKAPNTKWLLFFLFLFPIQVLTADVTLYVYDTFKVIIGYMIIYFVIIKHVHDINRIKIIFIILISVHLIILFLHPNIILAPEGRHYMSGTFLGDGNDFAWSVCIILPFTLFLAQTSSNKILKVTYYIMFCLLILTIIGTQSRGGSIALAMIILYLLIKSENKIRALAGIGVLVLLVNAYAPQEYFDRMETIMEYETDGSAQGRIDAWKYSHKMAKIHPFTGMGPGHMGPNYGKNAHSIYFLSLGEYGFPGLIFVLGIIVSSFIRNEKRLAEIGRTSSNSLILIHRKLILTMQTSLVGFAVGGAFLSGLYYPHLYVLSALLVSTYFITSTSQNKM